MNTASTSEEQVPPRPPARPRRARLRSDRGALTTELAILVAVLVFIAVALAGIMRTSSTNHQACIPQNPGDAVPAGC